MSEAPRDRVKTPLPTAAVYADEPLWPQVAQVAIWIALAIPALYQLGLLFTAISGRASYPYDLEWMEGGLLQHAQRIADGQGLYVAPSIDFIDMPEVLRGKYQYYTKADIAKLRSTGYTRAMTPLAEAVRDYVQGYLVPAKKLGE